MGVQRRFAHFPAQTTPQTLKKRTVSSDGSPFKPHRGAIEIIRDPSPQSGFLFENTQFMKTEVLLCKSRATLIKIKAKLSL